MSDLPHITVATVVPDGDRFLMVEENSNGRIVYNQPAGHLESGETLAQAALRETLEETGWHVRLEALLGIYHYTSSANNITYIRHCFIAAPLQEVENATLDPDIIAAMWLTEDDILARSAQLRSPIVLDAIRDYRRGIAHPLTVINDP